MQRSSLNPISDFTYIYLNLNVLYVFIMWSFQDPYSLLQDSLSLLVVCSETNSLPPVTSCSVTDTKSRTELHCSTNGQRARGVTTDSTTQPWDCNSALHSLFFTRRKYFPSPSLIPAVLDHSRAQQSSGNQGRSKGLTFYSSVGKGWLESKLRSHTHREKRNKEQEPLWRCQR